MTKKTLEQEAEEVVSGLFWWDEHNETHQRDLVRRAREVIKKLVDERRKSS